MSDICKPAKQSNVTAKLFKRLSDFSLYDSGLNSFGSYISLPLQASIYTQFNKANAGLLVRSK